ncbi:MAG: OmpH family outer membrane protein [Candidatus Poribacteria bacterium]|nr:OmpH family outer membrane protein [Candidatus Poribacteria bacterium]MDE0503383.1 OmpH family outer membrane protein [Candidatus Poribacteria bacterium]
MKRISILYVTVGIGLFLFAISTAAQNQFKLGVVDTQKVFEGYKRAKAADDVLKTAEDKLRTQLEDVREEIRTMEERLTKQKLFLQDPETERIESDIRLKKQEYQRELEIGQESILAKQKELVEPILKEIETLIKEIGKSGGYNLILEKRLVTLYVDPSYDLTDSVIETLNKRYEEANPSEPSDKDAETSETPQ